METIVLATFLGLLFPFVFLLANHNKMPYATTLIKSFIIFVVLLFLLNMLSTGTIFSWLSPKEIKVILYVWGVALLVLAVALVHCTGGIQSSIFSWLFGYAFIVTIIVRPAHKEKPFNQWMPVIFIVAFEILFIIVLACCSKYCIKIPDKMLESMGKWGGGSVGYSLALSFFLFFLSTDRLKRLEKKLKRVR